MGQLSAAGLLAAGLASGLDSVFASALGAPLVPSPARLRFLSPSFLKSVSYQPPPARRNCGAVSWRRTCGAPQDGSIFLNVVKLARLLGDAFRFRLDLAADVFEYAAFQYLAKSSGSRKMAVIILGGGASKEAEQFLPHLFARAKIVPARLLNQAGIIGAAIYAKEQG